MSNHICCNCFQETVNEYGVCTVCGYDSVKNREDYPLALPGGSILFGRYIVGKVLGQGGYGITYLAQDYQTKERVAIKEFFPETMATRTGVTRVSPYSGVRGEHFQYGKTSFLEEAQTMAEFIDNPNVARVLMYFEENNTAYFAMEYIDGCSFQEYIFRRGGKLSWAETMQVMLPVLDALCYVHEKGIIHRDIAPDNIFITSDGTVKLLDFGAARHSLGNVSQSLEAITKAGFAPKEQYSRRGRQGPYTDVYAASATIYFAITGTRPDESIDRAEEDTMPPPSVLGAKLTPHQEDVLLKGLAINAKDRYQTAAEFWDALMGQSVKTDKEETKTKTETEIKTEQESKAKSKSKIKTVDPAVAARAKQKLIGVGVALALLIVLGLIANGRSQKDEPLTREDIYSPTFLSAEEQAKLDADMEALLNQDRIEPILISTEEATFPTNAYPETQSDQTVPDNATESDSRQIDPESISNMLMETPFHNDSDDIKDEDTYFWGQTTYKRSDIAAVTFLNSLESVSPDAWDVSAGIDGSVMAWVDQNQCLFIAANGKIIANPNSSYLFDYFVNLKEISFNNNFDTSQMKRAVKMFANCKSLAKLDLSSFDTSNVTTMESMFPSCYSLQIVDLSSFDTSNVTDMSGMFEFSGQKSAGAIDWDLTGFDTKKVTDMAAMFSCVGNAEYADQNHLDLSNLDTSNVTDMNMMFFSINCSNLDLRSFDTSKVTDMKQMFSYCRQLNSLDLSHFQTESLENAHYMFSNSRISHLSLPVIHNVNGWNCASTMFNDSEIDSLISADTNHYVEYANRTITDN